MNFRNKTAYYYYKISFIVFFLGSPNFCVEDLKVSQLFYKCYRIVSICLNMVVPLFIVAELGAFLTQKNLSKKQEFDLLIYGISHPILWSYSVTLWNNVENIKKLFSHILDLKNVYNDEQVESLMLKKSKFNSSALALSCIMSMALHTASALMQFIKSEGTFTTVVTAWPLVDDLSRSANIARLLNYAIWWVFVSRVIASYIIIIALATSMSFQYMNLYSYFCSISDIFEEHALTQSEKESKYEESFKLGVKLHSDTIRCLDQFRNIVKGIFSAQLVFIVLMLVCMMTQMLKSERTLVNAAATAITITACLIGTGFMVWSAGDITVEAAKLSTAIYLSGWHNCGGKSSLAVRKLVVIAMTHAQKPVVIKGLGIINLSYRSYLSLVKSSYSVFSVLY